MKIETRKIYRCEHCKKVYLRKNACEYHEERCYKNPINFRICHGCKFLEKKTISLHHDTYYGEDTTREEALYCGKVDKFLMPVKIEKGFRGGYAQEDINDGEIPNEPMPTNCVFFEYE